MRRFEMQEAYGAVDVQGTLVMLRPGLLTNNPHESVWPTYALDPASVKVTIYDEILDKDHDITHVYMQNATNFQKLENFLIEIKNKDEAA